MRHEQDATDPELTQLERELGALTPAPGRFDRDLVMYRAGRNTNRHSLLSSRVPWIGLATCLGLVALGEGLLLVNRPSPTVIERVVFVHQPSPDPVVAERLSPTAPIDRIEPELSSDPDPSSPSSRSRLNSTSHGRLTAQIVRFGLDGLSSPVTTGRGMNSVESVSSRQLLQDEIEHILNLGGPS